MSQGKDGKQSCGSPSSHTLSSSTDSFNADLLLLKATYRKISNQHLLRGQLRAASTAERDSGFTAIVRLRHAEYRPDYMEILGPFSPGYVRARLPQSAIASAEADQNILSVELQAHHSSWLQ